MGNGKNKRVEMVTNLVIIDFVLGYDYPIPSNPLQLPDNEKELPIPSTTSIPAVSLITTPEAPGVTSTQSQISESTIAYPVPENPLQFPNDDDVQPIHHFSTPATLFASEYPTPPSILIPATTDLPNTNHQDPKEGYAYPIPANPLVLPEDPHKEPADFKPPPLEYGGFKPKPPFVPEPELPRTYQQPSYLSDITPSEIEYGFKPSDTPTQKPRRPFAHSSFEASAVPTRFSVQGQREVASVIPSGFTSATLSNGPNSIDNRIPGLDNNVNRFVAPDGSQQPGGSNDKPKSVFENPSITRGPPNRGHPGPPRKESPKNGGFKIPQIKGPPLSGIFNSIGNNLQSLRGGREFSQIKGTVGPKPNPNPFTAITRQTHKQPAIVTKFKDTDKNKFGPGGFRIFNETVGPEVCERPGLFRHPNDCDKFYECFYDKWIDKFTVHVFPCPIVLGYDTGITACNWPFEGPHCQQNV